MRLLAACSACKRQYDATGMAPAQRFRCSCGGLVTVAAPASAMLAVAHCATCGAARTGPGRACAFCGSAFADADLRRDTMCPGCYGQIDDAARFCDHCGIAIQPTRVAGAASTLPCPACNAATLRTRQLPEADHPIEECGRCGGAWLEITLFDRVVDRARSQATSRVAASAPAPRPATVQSGALYRPCPVCRELMNRRNYGGNSAVIVDTCRTHGIWFDADELGRVVAWVRSGGLDRQREREKADEEARLRSREIQAARAPRPEVERGDPTGGSRGGSGDLVEVGIDLLVGVLGSIFRKR